MKFKEYQDYCVWEDGLILNRNSNTEIKKHLNPKGYWWSTFKIDGKYKTMGIHRFITLAWDIKRPRFDIYMEIDHIDDNKINNRPDNLQWLTKSENNQKTWDANHKNNDGINNGRCKTSEKIVKYICKLLQKGYMPAQIRDMGYSYSLVRSIRLKKNWSWLSKDYKW